MISFNDKVTKILRITQGAGRSAARGYPVPSRRVQGTLTGISVAILMLLLFVSDASAQQRPTNVTVHRNDGLVRSVQIRSSNSKGITWTGRNAPNPQFMSHGEIGRVDFPEPELWRQANDYYYRGDYAKAIAAFSSISNDPRTHFHPTPGNYTSRARFRLIECYRETGNAKAIVETAARLDAESLPGAQRGRMAIVKAWADLGKGNWDGALAKAEAISANPIAPDRSDLGFIKAVAMEKTGKINEAIVAYGTAFTVDFGGSRELAKRALQNAILLLINQNNVSREGEMHSLVHAYAKVYNKGRLWQGAPARAVELLDKKLELPEKKLEPEPQAEPVIAESEPVAKPEVPQKSPPKGKPTGKNKNKGKAKGKSKGPPKGTPKGGNP